MANVYWTQIQAILAPGRSCMANFAIATPEGSFQARLDDYETVKRLHAVIATALNAWERDANGQWSDPPVPLKPHAMPPGAPLPVEHVDAFLAWVKDGMPKEPLVA